MIQPLRDRHRWTFGVLAIILPALFIAGLAMRSPLPVQSGNIPERGPHRVSVLTGSDYRISIHLPGSEGRSIAVGPGTYTQSPDVLVYWSSDPGATRLTAGSRLLGPLRVNAAYDPPAPGGALIFYSVPTGKTIANLALGGRS